MRIIWDFIRWVPVRRAQVDAKTATIQWALNTVFRMVAVAIFATTCGSAFVVTKSLESEKPENVPTYQTHLKQGNQMCEQPMVMSKPDLWATDVVVVKQDGKTVKMDTTEAWNRGKSPERSDDVWVIGICAEDLVAGPTGEKDVVVDVTFE